MKKILLSLILFVAALPAFSQSQFEVLPDRDGSKILKGIISRDLLQKDTSFKWYAQGLVAYTPSSDAVAALKKNGDSIQFVVFMGTWCEDSHMIIPRFFSLLDVAGFSQDKVTLFGVDRSKKTLSHLTEALNIINVPTIMVMKNGKEMGRVVEYGKYGLFEKELAEIINSMNVTAH